MSKRHLLESFAFNNNLNLKKEYYECTKLYLSINVDSTCLHLDLIRLILFVFSFQFKENDAKKKENILLTSTKNSVTTLTMNTPKKLNGWTQEMMMAMR
jgi:hypothetical protein